MGSLDIFDLTKPLVTEGYVSPQKGEPFQLRPVTLPPLKSSMVQVAIKHVGLCHTDLHMRDNDWGVSDYPFCAGHEGVGVITALGADVKTFALGDRVGISWIRDSCGACGRCLEGRENICDDGYQGTYLGKSAGCWGKSSDKYNECGGCYTRVQRIEARFAVRVPDTLSDDMVCPLLCGGATMYEPMVTHAPAGVGTRVGIMGLGGLGRCGVKLSKLRGNHTVVISSSPGKREAALMSGADEFWCTADGEDMMTGKEKLDVIIDTTPANPDHDMGKTMGMLKFSGTYCRVGIPKATEQKYQYLWIPQVFCTQSVTGSAVTGTKRLDDMMRLCGANAKFLKEGEDIFSAEIIPFDQVNEALDQLANRTNNCYRYILKW